MGGSLMVTNANPDMSNWDIGSVYLHGPEFFMTPIFLMASR